ncbi:MAG: hypothetical protein HC918_11600 [Oscillatoriales cyanobacterium SM2_1_8]|nr:hypothetical protein [Oscillatoriales cyanobacterium SM2_1_8]
MTQEPQNIPRQTIEKQVNVAQTGDNNTQNNTFILEAVKKAAIPFSLPPSNVTFFAGRDGDLAKVHSLLQQNQRLAVSAFVKGMGGVGKTELAIQYALGHVLQEYRGGVCWLQTSSDLALQVKDFVRVQLHEKVPDDLDTGVKIAAYCWKMLADRLANLAGEGCRFLVILDDVKADYEQAIRPYLPPMDGGFAVLATTRLELGQAMQQYRLDVLAIEAAVDLLKSFLGPEDRRRAEDEAIKKLCEWLGRLPLAVELVGRYLARKPDLTIAQMQERLNQKRLLQDALTDQQRRALAEMTGKLNILAAFELSWQELSVGAKQVASALGLFALAPLPWGWVEAVCSAMDAETLENIRDEELLNLHLLERSEQGMYQLHQLIREYFQFQLQQNPTQSSTLRQQVAAFLLTIAKGIGQTITQEQNSCFCPRHPPPRPAQPRDARRYCRPRRGFSLGFSGCCQVL